MCASSSEEIELDNILEAYFKDRGNPRYRFRQLIVAVAQDGESVLQHKPQDVDASQWKEVKVYVKAAFSPFFLFLVRKGRRGSCFVCEE